jgi:predicted HicB family RNase H-like nuclease
LGDKSIRYKGYEGHFEFDEEARLFHGEVVGIRDVITFQSIDQADLELQFMESVDVYLDFCQRLNQAPERPSQCL